MREIEIKAKVSNLSTLLNTIENSGIKLSNPIKQHDVVYGQLGIADNTPGAIWLRIRTENDTRKIFTFKQQHSGGLDSIEHETDISNSDELDAIIKALGFTLYSDLTKTRRKANYSGIEICVDDVDNLGTFIEAEKLANDDADGGAIATDLWHELAKLGVDRVDEVFEGYDVLMNRKLSENK